MRRYETFVWAAILVGGFTPVTEATPVQWPVAVGGNGHFYEAFSVSAGISWTNASQLANLKGGYLVTITSQAENDFVYNLINDPIYWDGPSGPWIGGYQPPGSPEPAGGWRWVTDEPFIYTNWNEQQPNEFNGNNENRIHFGYTTRTPFWNDVPDTAVTVDGRRIRGYIVETIPEPATYFVDASVPPGGDGSSWMKAFNHLLDALVVAKSGDEVRVAQGLYSTGGPPPDIRQASNPNPANGAIGVSRTAYLSWTAGSDAISHDVYFGTISPGIFQGNQTATTFDPGTMAYSTTYYWRIDELNNGSKVTGKVWSFTTMMSPPPPLESSNEDESIEPADDRSATFQLKSGVIIKGGYAGFGEPNPDARDVGTYETVLSGDLLGNDGPDFANNGENSYHVVTGSGCDETAVLDGFTITAGNANENYPSQHANGGGMYNYYGNPTINNCKFIDNSAKHGGGISSWPGSPVVSDSKFSGNSAELGGAVFNYDSSSTLTNCIFSNNYAELWGGAICSTIIIPEQQNNSSSPGEETNNENSIPLFADYTFSNNSSGYDSNVNNASDNSTLTGCTFSGNSAMAGGGVCYIVEGSPSLDNCTFVGNSALIGGGLVNAISTMTITNCKVNGNSGEYYGGAFYNETGSATITNCIFSQNTSSFYGGAINEFLSSSSLYNCLITGNSSSLYGGAMYYWYGSGPQMFNCTFAGNSAPLGNAIVCAIPEGGGVVPPSTVIASNCIFWDGGNEIANLDNSIITVTYSDVEGGYSGIGNMTADPCFFQPEYLGPISYWKFDEAGGSTVYDSVGHNHGTVYGAQWTTGQLDGALHFDGFNDYVDCGNNASLDITDKVTITLWVKTNDVGNFQHNPYVTKGDRSYAIKHYVDNSIQFFIYDGEWRVAWFHVDSSFNGVWHHLAGTYDGSSLKLYIDSQLRNTTAHVGSIASSGYSLNIGRNPQESGRFYDGLIDEVAIYGRALSPDEIQQLYLSSLYGLPYPDEVKPDYHLLENSPCINTGDPYYMAAPDETDLDGKPRVIGGRIDMGAYEFNHIPVADAGQDQTVEAQAPWGATVTLDGSGSSDADSTPGTSDDITDFNWYKLDPCDPNADVLLGSGVIIECNLPISENIILLEVIDKAGASDTDEVTIIVQDTTPPDINCPPDVTIECPADTSPSATGKPTATDTCSDVSIRCRNRIIPGCGNTETIERTWIATDDYGNSSSCVQVITVVDTTPPVIACPADVTLECPADTSVEANGSATAGDTCGSVAIAHSDQWQQGCGNTGILTRTWTATDECGNSASCIQTITVVDTTPPDFELSVSPTMLWPPDHKMVQVTPGWIVNDECDASPNVSLVSITMSEDDNSIGDGHTTGDIGIGEGGEIYVRSERSGANSGRIYTITYQAVDDCGNVTIRSATVSIPHDFKVLTRIADRWLLSGREGSIQVDFNDDGIVNLADFARFAQNWTK